MAQTSSPTVWRRWLALELRRLRQEAGLSMQEVAKRLGCTSTKVSYMEGAERSVQERDLQTLLQLYEVPDDRRETYVQASKDARKKGWWEKYDERTLPTWHSLYIGLEQGAARLRTYEPQIVDGLLQTPEYTTAVVRRGPAPRAEEQVARLVELRATRQEALTREATPLEFWAVLDEAALRRKVGSAEIMHAQLQHIAEMAERPNVTVQVLPFSAGAHGATFGPFKILGFPWKTDPGVVYLEHRDGALYLEQQHEVEAHSLTFQQLCALALSPDESAAMLRAVARDWGT